MRRVSIIGSGMAVPAQEVSAAMLDARLGLRTGTSFKKTGVRRRFLSSNETAAQLAARACQTALEDAGLAWSEIDCLVATSATMDQALPYNAALIHAELKLSARRTTTFDIGASCMSFLTGFDTMSYLVEAGRYQYVMLVSSDIATFGLDWNNLTECGIFGDGAAAVVIRRSLPSESSCILSSSSITLSAGVDHCRIPAGGSRYHPRRLTTPIDALSVFQMEGRSAFKLIAAEMAEFTEGLLNKADVSMKQITKIVPHQASQLAIHHLTKRLGVSSEKVMNIFADYGNQVGASLPTALHLCRTGQHIARGDTMMLIGSGAGLTLGGMVLVY
ncbi:3-oxoacyl-[acyl-carrier-protein] synthase III C-terminal domain-containing protein [Undibacterium sp. Di27W]|uniref:3-oxoacyl-[acyl-carrier-protein] synthase III C-terminal domain-containing protein n=1 Tax=Undibacterium sp. Di27W TaxID=3413036 RepID=UPI003BEF652E